MKRRVTAVFENGFKDAICQDSSLKKIVYVKHRKDKTQDARCEGCPTLQTSAFCFIDIATLGIGPTNCQRPDQLPDRVEEGGSQHECPQPLILSTKQVLHDWSRLIVNSPYPLINGQWNASKKKGEGPRPFPRFKDDGSLSYSVFLALYHRCRPPMPRFRVQARSTFPSCRRGTTSCPRQGSRTGSARPR